MTSKMTKAIIACLEVDDDYDTNKNYPAEELTNCY
jgi:hypothetical protein